MIDSSDSCGINQNFPIDSIKFRLLINPWDQDQTGIKLGTNFKTFKIQFHGVPSLHYVLVCKIHIYMPKITLSSLLT